MTNYVFLQAIPFNILEKFHLAKAKAMCDIIRDLTPSSVCRPLSDPKGSDKNEGCNENNGIPKFPSDPYTIVLS